MAVISFYIVYNYTSTIKYINDYNSMILPSVSSYEGLALPCLTLILLGYPWVVCSSRGVPRLVAPGPGSGPELLRGGRP